MSMHFPRESLLPMSWEAFFAENISPIESIEQEIAGLEEKGQMGEYLGECYERAALFYKDKEDFPKAFFCYLKAAENYLLASPSFPREVIREADGIVFLLERDGLFEEAKEGIELLKEMAIRCNSSELFDLAGLFFEQKTKFLSRQNGKETEMSEHLLKVHQYYLTAPDPNREQIFSPFGWKKLGEAYLFFNDPLNAVDAWTNFLRTSHPSEDLSSCTIQALKICLFLLENEKAKEKIKSIFCAVYHLEKPSVARNQSDFIWFILRPLTQEIGSFFALNDSAALAIESAKEALVGWSSMASVDVLEIIYMEAIFSDLKILHSTQNREVRERAAEYLYELDRVRCHRYMNRDPLNHTKELKLNDLDFLIELSPQDSKSVGFIAAFIHEAYRSLYEPSEKRPFWFDRYTEKRSINPYHMARFLERIAHGLGSFDPHYGVCLLDAALHVILSENENRNLIYQYLSAAIIALANTHLSDPEESSRAILPLHLLYCRDDTEACQKAWRKLKEYLQNDDFKSLCLDRAKLFLMDFLFLLIPRLRFSESQRACLLALIEGMNRAFIDYKKMIRLAYVFEKYPDHAKEFKEFFLLSRDNPQLFDLQLEIALSLSDLCHEPIHTGLNRLLNRLKGLESYSNFDQLKLGICGLLRIETQRWIKDTPSLNVLAPTTWEQLADFFSFRLSSPRDAIYCWAMVLLKSSLAKAPDYIQHFRKINYISRFSEQVLVEMSDLYSQFEKHFYANISEKHLDIFVGTVALLYQDCEHFELAADYLSLLLDKRSPCSTETTDKVAETSCWAGILYLKASSKSQKRCAEAAKRFAKAAELLNIESGNAFSEETWITGAWLLSKLDLRLRFRSSLLISDSRLLIQICSLLQACTLAGWQEELEKIFQAAEDGRPISLDGALYILETHLKANRLRDPSEYLQELRSSGPDLKEKVIEKICALYPLFEKHLLANLSEKGGYDFVREVTELYEECERFDLAGNYLSLWAAEQCALAKENTNWLAKTYYRAGRYYLRTAMKSERICRAAARCFAKASERLGFETVEFAFSEETWIKWSLLLSYLHLDAALSGTSWKDDFRELISIVSLLHIFSYGGHPKTLEGIFYEFQKGAFLPTKTALKVLKTYQKIPYAFQILKDMPNIFSRLQALEFFRKYSLIEIAMRLHGAWETMILLAADLHDPEIQEILFNPNRVWLDQIKEYEIDPDKQFSSPQQVTVLLREFGMILDVYNKKFPEKIVYKGKEALDVSGVTRDAMALLFQSLYGKEQPLLPSQVTETGNIPLFPIQGLSEDESSLLFLSYRSIGQLFALNVTKIRNFQTGVHFHPAIFQVLYALKQSDLEQIPYTGESSLLPPKITGLILRYLYPKLFEDLDMDLAIEAFMSSQIIPTSIQELGIKDFKEFASLYEIDQMVRAISAIALGIRLFIPNWDKLKTDLQISSGDILSLVIQGTADVEQILASLVWTGDVDCLRTKEFFEQWIREARESKRAKFLYAISGSYSLFPGQELIILFIATPDRYPEFHTCFFTMDLSIGFSKYEEFSEKMNRAVEEAAIGFSKL